MTTRQNDILANAVRKRFPTPWHRVLDDWQWSLTGIIISIVCFLLESIYCIAVHETAATLTAGIIALVGIAASASLGSVPVLISGNFKASKDPSSALEKIIAIIWNNIVWLLLIAIISITINVIAMFPNMIWLGSLMPGLAIMAIFRTYLVTRETFRIYIALALDKFSE